MPFTLSDHITIQEYYDQRQNSGSTKSSELGDRRLRQKKGLINSKQLSRSTTFANSSQDNSKLILVTKFLFDLKHNTHGGDRETKRHGTKPKLSWYAKDNPSSSVFYILLFSYPPIKYV